MEAITKAVAPAANNKGELKGDYMKEERKPTIDPKEAFKQGLKSELTSLETKDDRSTAKFDGSIHISKLTQHIVIAMQKIAVDAGVGMFPLKNFVGTGETVTSLGVIDGLIREHIKNATGKNIEILS